MSQAISASTHKEDDFDFDHVAILYIDNNIDSMVIEAVPKDGVRVGPLNEFLDMASKINGAPCIVVKRVNLNLDFDKIIRNALSHLGEPYDFEFARDNGKMYCSELIYESYLDEEGRHIFNEYPMRFRDSEGNMPEFWVELFQDLKRDIPEGDQGTNPNDMAKDENLFEVFRYF